MPQIPRHGYFAASPFSTAESREQCTRRDFSACALAMSVPVLSYPVAAVRRSQSCGPEYYFAPMFTVQLSHHGTVNNRNVRVLPCCQNTAATTGRETARREPTLLAVYSVAPHPPPRHKHIQTRFYGVLWGSCLILCTAAPCTGHARAACREREPSVGVFAFRV